jgi:hypothetical protein
LAQFLDGLNSFHPAGFGVEERLSLFANAVLRVLLEVSFHLLRVLLHRQRPKRNFDWLKRESAGLAGSILPWIAACAMVLSSNPTNKAAAQLSQPAL